jgi:hypothetical protein
LCGRDGGGIFGVAEDGLRRRREEGTCCQSGKRKDVVDVHVDDVAGREGDRESSRKKGEKRRKVNKEKEEAEVYVARGAMYLDSDMLGVALEGAGDSWLIMRFCRPRAWTWGKMGPKMRLIRLFLLVKFCT